jgi:phage portal protein BeeE
MANKQITTRPNLTARINSALKAFWGSGDWVSSDRPGNRFTSQRIQFEPQTALNYSALVGDLWNNSACQACLNAAMRAWPDSYPVVKEKAPNGKKINVDDHPLTALLESPNDAYDDTVLWAGTILSYWVDGNAYWGINRTKGSREIGEFVYIPHQLIRPMRKPGSLSIGPESFEMLLNNVPTKIPVEDVVHFRFGIDPYNTLLGMSGWKSVNRNVYTDNEAINYVATNLRNRGAAWMIVSPKDSDTGFEDPDKIKKDIVDNTSGDNRSGVLVLDGAIDVKLPTPMKDMAIDTAHRIPETRICALAGFPVIAVGLAAGLERSTFENTDQAMAAFWNTIVAVQRMMGRQMTQQILRRPGNFPDYEAKTAKRKFWAGFDYSDVRALQPNKQLEWTRIGEAFDRSLLTEDEARAEMGYDPMTTKQKASIAPPAPVAIPGAAPVPDLIPAKPGTNGTGKARGYALVGVMEEPAPSDWVDRIVTELGAIDDIPSLAISEFITGGES